MLIDNIAKLFQKKNICIPVIQRDYAQGRNEEFIVPIRVNFIRSLFDAVSGNKIMDINYIYGINKPGDEFLPIDGQQRITSIFLFLWFCCVKEGKTREFCTKIKNFSYMVRSTAEEFFGALQKQEDGGLTYLSDFEDYLRSKDMSLKNCSWFKFAWNNDMTVEGAVTFLDSIKLYVEENQIQFGGFTDKLLDEEKCPVSLVMIIQNENDAENLSEKEREEAAFEAENRAAITYINMNERGKILNDFENVKALLYKKGEQAKAFLVEYDEKHINVFLSEVERNVKGLSFAQQVTKMDGLMLSFLLNIFNDLEVLNGNENRLNYYQFMDCLRGNVVFREDYFDFMSMILADYNDYSEDEKDKLYHYCNNYTVPNRYGFFAVFWPRFKNITQDKYWAHFCKHLRLYELGIGASDAKEFRYFVNLVNYVSEDQNILQTLSTSKAEKLFLRVTEKGKDYGSIVDKATLHEEILKANIILSGVNNQDEDVIIRIFEECGARHGSKIRYLFYISGLWDGSPIETGKWNELLKYISVDRQIFPLDNSLMWEKIYYLSAVNRTNGVYVIPNCNVDTVWNNDRLYWKSLDPEYWVKSSLERVKQCFEEVNAEKGLENLLRKQISDIGTDRRVWLFYLLRRNYRALFANDISVVNGVYHKQAVNYYEAVLEADLIENGYKIHPAPYTIYWGEKLVTQTVKPRENDGFSNQKNMRVELRVYLKVNGERFFYLCNGDSIFRYQFHCFNKNNEDVFDLEEDSSSMSDFRTKCGGISTKVKQALKAFSYDDYYDWVFLGDCTKLANELTRIGIPSCKCYKEGQNEIRITIDMEQVFTICNHTLSMHDEIVHYFDGKK